MDLALIFLFFIAIGLFLLAGLEWLFQIPYQDILVYLVVIVVIVIICLLVIVSFFEIRRFINRRSLGCDIANIVKRTLGADYITFVSSDSEYKGFLIYNQKSHLLLKVTFDQLGYKNPHKDSFSETYNKAKQELGWVCEKKGDTIILMSSYYKEVFFCGG